MKALLVHPGTQYSYQLARQLEKRKSLASFWTGLAYVPDSPQGWVIQHSPKALQRALANRRLEGVSSARLRSRPWNELRAFRRLRNGHDDQLVMFQRNECFQKVIPEKEIEESDVTIGFDTSSWLLAERAKQRGKPFVLDQSIGHPGSLQRLSPALRNLFEDWAEDLPYRLPCLTSAEKSEHATASRIVAASSFTRKTLIENGVDAQKIVVNPYGVDLSAFSPTIGFCASRPLRFIFIGSVGARKGIPLLLEAWRTLDTGDAELWLVGPLSARNARRIPLLKGLTVIDKAPHKDVPALLRKCDVLVLPSYFEGFGLVLLEALASGLPIIATESTAAPDLITSGKEGYIIPVGDLDALRESIRKFVISRNDLGRMSQASRRCAEKYSWDSYGDRWVQLLDEVA